MEKSESTLNQSFHSRRMMKMLYLALMEIEEMLDQCKLLTTGIDYEPIYTYFLKTESECKTYN